MKYRKFLQTLQREMSPPARVVWIEICILTARIMLIWSPPARVVWIEMQKKKNMRQPSLRRHPRGWCGLKSVMCPTQLARLSRHPRGWCGLKFGDDPTTNSVSRRHPRGWCGLKCFGDQFLSIKHCRHPRGWCGLKCVFYPPINPCFIVATREGGVD